MFRYRTLDEQKGNRGFVKLGVDRGACGGGLREVNVNLEGLFLFDSDVAQICLSWSLPVTTNINLTYSHNEISSFSFIAYDAFSDLSHFLDFNGGVLGPAFPVISVKAGPCD